MAAVVYVWRGFREETTEMRRSKSERASRERGDKDRWYETRMARTKKLTVFLKSTAIAARETTDLPPTLENLMARLLIR